MPNIHYDKLIEYENDNDIASIVKDYIELNVKCGNGTATQEEIEARDDYIAHLIETDENEKPTRGIHFITRLNEEILKIKADLNIQMAMEGKLQEIQAVMEQKMKEISIADVAVNIRLKINLTG